MLTNNNKGGQQLIMANYKYNMKRKNLNHIIWCCSVRNCPAKAKTNINVEEYVNSFTLVNTNHNHFSHINEIKKNKMIKKMKKLTIISDRSPRWVVNEILKGANREVVLMFPKLESLYKTLRNYKQRHFNPKPYKYTNLKLSNLLSKSHTNEQFYQYGIDNFGNYEHHDDFLIFYSNNSITRLYSEEIWCVDGTFSVVSKPYMQLFTISFLKNNSVFPVVFCIMKNKLENTYNNFFKILKNINGLYQPKIFKIDFEQASIKAIKKNFPESTISCCQFHLGQAIQRKLQELRLMVFYKTIPVVKVFVKALTALSYVHPNKILDLILQLKTHQDFPIILSDLYNYFENTYIRGMSSTRYPITLWNCYNFFLDDDFVRTNNAIEGWHSVFSKTFHNSKYGLSRLVSKLKDEEDCIRLKTIRNDLGFVVRRKAKYIRIENNLTNFLRDLNGDLMDVENLFRLTRLLFY